MVGKNGGKKVTKTAAVESCAEAFGYHPRTIWRKMAPRDPAPKRGRPAVDYAKHLHARTITRIAMKVKTVRGRRLPEFPSCRAITQELNRQIHPLTLGKSTVNKILNATCVHRMRPKTTFTAEQKAKRLAFVEDWLAKARAVTDRIIFSDEHKINTNDHTSAGQWIVAKPVKRGRQTTRQPVTEPIPRVWIDPRNVANVMIWAAMGLTRRGRRGLVKAWRSQLIFIDKTFIETTNPATGRKQYVSKWMDAEQYINLVLKPHVEGPASQRFPDDCIFMQDGAACHTAKKTSAYLAKHHIEVLKPWCAGSPDLNPAEHIWHELDRRIAAKCPRTLAELKQAAIEAWHEIPDSFIINYVRNFRSDCENCRNAKGGGWK